jgi:hypothetical protein
MPLRRACACAVVVIVSLQVDKILDPLGQLDDEFEDCVFDDHGRAYCTENHPWSDAGAMRAVAALVRCC